MVIVTDIRPLSISLSVYTSVISTHSVTGDVKRAAAVAYLQEMTGPHFHNILTSCLTYLLSFFPTSLLLIFKYSHVQSLPVLASPHSVLPCSEPGSRCPAE